MAVDLLTPILTPQLRGIHFFNGRLVSGEDMTDEQNAHRAVHQLLGHAIGDGVVSGLEVAQADFGSTAEAPVLNVRQGVAVNRRGETLVLPEDVEVRLVRPPSAAPRVTGDAVFHTCTPPRSVPPFVDAAVYLLTITSSRTGEGNAGLSALPARCSMRWVVDSVEFRLVNLNVSAELQLAPDRLRNRVAHACFGSSARMDYATNPFGETDGPATLIDALRGTDLTDCDVPLALVQWKTSGLAYVDVWSARRRCASGATGAGSTAFSARSTPAAEAMFHQFTEQILDLQNAPGNPETIQGRRYFRYLPPAGFLPVSSGAVRRFDPATFFAGKTTSVPWYIEAGDVEAILREAVHYPPVDLEDPELVWIYLVRENRASSIDLGEAAPDPFGIQSTARAKSFGVPHYVLFANANVPFFGNSRFNRSHFDFANFV